MIFSSSFKTSVLGFNMDVVGYIGEPASCEVSSHPRHNRYLSRKFACGTFLKA